MAGSYPGSLQEEQLALSYARQAAAIPEIMGGFSDSVLKSRATASGGAQNLRESKGVFGAIISGVEESWGRIGMYIFYQLVRNKDLVLEREGQRDRLTETELDSLRRVLDVELENIPHRVQFSILTSDIDQTFEVQRQNMLTLTQLHTMFLREITPYAQQLFGPEAQQMQQQAPDFYRFLLESYTDRTRLMRRIIEFFNEDPRDFTSDTRKQEIMLEMIQVMENPGNEMMERKLQEMKEQKNGPIGPSLSGMGGPGGGGAPPAPGGLPGQPQTVPGQPSLVGPPPNGGPGD
jgi:hypothetical protein